LSILYLKLPPKAAYDTPFFNDGAVCSFALASDTGDLKNEGRTSLSSLAELLRKARHAVVILAASDVTQLQIKTPPLSMARLKLALPGLVEDQLLADTADCIVMAGALSAGLHTVFVVQRSWLKSIAHTLTALGARHIVALPAQSTVPDEEGVTTAVLTEHAQGTELAIRLLSRGSIGLWLAPQQADPLSPDQPQNNTDALTTLRAIVPHDPIVLYAVPTLLYDVQRAADAQIRIVEDNWQRRIGSIKNAIQKNNAPNMMSHLGLRQANLWRWPLALAAALLIVNMAALNIEWWRAAHQVRTLQAGMEKIYRTIYPKDPIILDPLAQMQQKIATARRATGQSTPDDFTTLSASFSQAWFGLAPTTSAGNLPSISALEYHDRSLLIRLKNGTASDALTASLKTALTARHLSLSQTTDGIWEIKHTP